VASRVERTQLPLAEALLPLLEEKGISQRQLARGIGISQSHLSRVISGETKVSTQLAGEITVELDLPKSYFREVREGAVIAAIVDDVKLLDALYDALPPTAR
jgi:transcriptional regulator with XRE-family HTH domain